MAVWSALFIAAVVAIALVLFNGGGGKREGGGSSRHSAIYTFDAADYHSLGFSPGRAGFVLYGHHNGVQMSEDGGRTWTELINELGRDAMNLVFDPASSDTVYMAGHNVYMKSTDGGVSWHPVDSDLPGLDLHTFGASLSQEGRFYAIPAGFGLYRSDDSGRTWQLIWEDAPAGSNSIVELPDGTMLLGATDAGIVRSADGGKSWAPSRAGIQSGAILTVRGSADGSRLYAGTTNGLYVSTDGGQNWIQTTLNDTFGLVVGVDPSDPLDVLVVNSKGQLYASRDGGQTWE